VEVKRNFRNRLSKTPLVSEALKTFNSGIQLPFARDTLTGSVITKEK